MFILKILRIKQNIVPFQWSCKGFARLKIFVELKANEGTENKFIKIAFFN